jgi:Cys-rich repeat protein
MTDTGETNYHRLKGLAGEEICKEDTDCAGGWYCEKGVAHNACTEQKDIGGGCTRDAQCLAGRCAALRCAEPDECQADGDCGTGKYCNTGVAELGRNVCAATLADGKACTKDPQCTSRHCSEWRPQDGQTSGICYTPASKQAGETCRLDLECKQGKCNSNKTCVCKEDSDCGQGFWCDGGVDLKDNTCRRKLAKGESCGVGVGVGHRCLSGKCTLGKCQ